MMGLKQPDETALQKKTKRHRPRSHCVCVLLRRGRRRSCVLRSPSLQGTKQGGGGGGGVFVSMETSSVDENELSRRCQPENKKNKRKTK